MTKTSVIKFFLIFLIPSFFVGSVWAQHPEADSSETPALPQPDSSAVRIPKYVPAWSINTSEFHPILAEDIIDYSHLLPAIAALDLGTVGQLSPLMVRGSRAQHTLILLDGMPLFEPVTGSLLSKYVPLNLLEKFTFPGYGRAVPFGGFTAGSALDFRTHEIDRTRPYSKVIFRSGDFGYSDLGLILGLPINPKTQFRINGNRQEFGGAARNHTGSRVLVNISRDLGPSSAFKSVSFLNKNDVTLPAPFIPNLSRLGGTSNWHETRFDQLFSLRMGSLSTQHRQLLARLLITRISQSSSIDSIKNRNLSLSAHLQYEALLGRHRLALGGEFKLDDLSSAKLGNHADRIASVFVREALKIGAAWGLDLQLQLEKHDAFAIAFNPSLRLNYEVSHPLELWLGLQRGQRYPSFGERYWPGFYRGDPRLSDETATAAEIGMAFKNRDRWRLQASLFVNRIDDWIGHVVLADTSGVRPRNLGKRTVSGLELKFVWETFPGGRFGLVGSLLKVAETEGEKQLQVPEYAIFAYLETGRPFFQDYVFIRLRLTSRIFGERRGIDYSIPLPDYTKLEPKAIFDGQISLEFADARALFSIENLLGTRYRLVPGFFMPERWFRFGIEWEFWD